MNKNFIFKSLCVLGSGIVFIFIMHFVANSVNAQSKEQLCQQYSSNDSIYQCCMTHNLDNFEECFNSEPAQQQQQQTAPQPAGEQQPSQPQQPAVAKPINPYATTQGLQAYNALRGCLEKNDLKTCNNDTAYKKIVNDTVAQYNQCRTGCNSYKHTLDDIYKAYYDATFFAPGVHNPGPDLTLPHNFTQEFKSLAGGLSRPFDEIYWRSRQITPTTTTDNAGNPVALEDILKKGWKNAPPIIKIEIPLENLQKEELVGTELPPGSPLGKMLFATYDPVKYANTQITIFEGKTTPEILRQTSQTNGPISKEDVQVPDPQKYDISFYFRIGTVLTENDEEIHPFAGAMFEILPWLAFDSPDKTKNVRVLRWDSDQLKWNELPLSQEEDCDDTKRSCSVFAKSPGTSYFAVVANKQTPSLAPFTIVTLFLRRLAFLVGVIFLIVWFVRRMKKNRMKKKNAVGSRKTRKG